MAYMSDGSWQQFDTIFLTDTWTPYTVQFQSDQSNLVLGVDFVFWNSTAGAVEVQLDDIRIQHVSSAKDVQYTYLGLGTIVTEDYAQSQVKLDYVGTSPSALSGFDRFGRVADQLWANYGTSPDTLADLGYGYDPSGNRLYREDLTSKSVASPVYLDELYSYNQLNELTEKGDRRAY
jgi:hypothetical protein